jgi:Peptidase family M1 domain
MWRCAWTFAALIALAAAVEPLVARTEQTGPQGLFEPRTVTRAYAADTRSRDGRPGPRYWQNTASYVMDITVAPPARRIVAREEITYVNRSPAALPSLLLKLYLNIHRPDALREDAITPAFLNEGLRIDDFRINGVAKDLAALPPPQGVTWRNVTLDRPLAPGASVVLSVAWSYELSRHNWKEGVVDDTTFFLAYFFPRVAVLDDIDLAFDAQEFSSLSREFNNDFSDFTFTVHVPRNFAVWATGDLLNPAEVLQPAYAQRLQRSFTSDTAVTVATPADMRRGAVTAQSTMVGWTWRATNVPDIAIGISDHYVWDAASVVVDVASGRRASVQAAYNPEATDFRQAIEFASRALTFGSTRYPGVPYPYSKMTLFRGDADEEYPMMANDASNPTDPTFSRFVAAHEILHSWFPFYMGTNEQRYPFMDEGWTTAFEHLFLREVDGVEAAERLFRTFRTAYLGPVVIDADIPVVTPLDAMKHGGLGFANNAYVKPALGYLALRDLLGDEMFRASLHEFIRRWNGKRPSPWDMFATFNAASSRNLNWFFTRWFFDRSHIDLAVAGVTMSGGTCAVRVHNAGGMPIPFDLEVTLDDGSVNRFHATPAIWEAAPTATLQLAVSQPVRAVSVNGGIFADATPSDNTWTRQ